MKKLHSWQAKTLAVLALMFVGMLIRDAVATLFSSQWHLITTDWTAAASISIFFAIEALILSVIFSKTSNGHGQNNRQFHNRENKPHNG